MIYHITTSSDWGSKKLSAEFFPEDYLKEGFIHCCTSDQLSGVLERYFKGKIGLVILHLDESKLKARLLYEKATGDEYFPHLYGPINKEAILNVEMI